MSNIDKQDGHFIGNFACVQCESSDAMALYRKEGDEGAYLDAFCRGASNCGYIKPSVIAEHYDVDNMPAPKVRRKINLQELEKIESEGFFGWKKRGTGAKVAEKYSVHTVVDMEARKLTDRYYKITRAGETVGYKRRMLPKDFSRPVGDVGATSELFGQSVFEKGQRYLCICTGEEDALAVAEALHTVKDGKEYWTPVVSVTCGDGAIPKQIKSNFDYINSFEKVILMFDNDESAQAQVEVVARLLNPGKVHIAKLSMKDPCEMMGSGKEGDLRNAFWKAEKFSPIDVCSLGELWDEYENAENVEIMSLPSAFDELSDLMGGGIAAGEVTVIGALTSVGKSTILNLITHHAAFVEGRKTGIIPLESSPKEVIDGMLSIYVEENLALKKHSEKDMVKLKAEFKKMIGNDDKMMVINHHGSFQSADEMLDKCRWMIKAGGCEVVVIDPLQLAVPSNENGVIDNFMDSLLKLAKETNAKIIVVSHMRKPKDDNPHSVSEYDLKGSASINQVAFNTILLSRDKISSDKMVKNSTKVTLVKCRRTGGTGDGGWLYYDALSAKLKAGSDPYAQADMAIFEPEAGDMQKPERVANDNFDDKPTEAPWDVADEKSEEDEQLF